MAGQMAPFRLTQRPSSEKRREHQRENSEGDDGVQNYSLKHSAAGSNSLETASIDHNNGNASHEGRQRGGGGDGG
jgi:hypothetical protein